MSAPAAPMTTASSGSGWTRPNAFFSRMGWPWPSRDVAGLLNVAGVRRAADDPVGVGAVVQRDADDLAGAGDGGQPGQPADGDGLAGAVRDRPLDGRPGRRPVLDQVRHGQAGVEQDGVLARCVNGDRDSLRARYRYRAKLHELASVRAAPAVAKSVSRSARLGRGLRPASGYSGENPDWVDGFRLPPREGPGVPPVFGISRQLVRTGSITKPVIPNDFMVPASRPPAPRSACDSGVTP